MSLMLILGATLLGETWDHVNLVILTPRQAFWGLGVPRVHTVPLSHCLLGAGEQRRLSFDSGILMGWHLLPGFAASSQT